jgi:hypothetical protein
VLLQLLLLLQVLLLLHELLLLGLLLLLHGVCGCDRVLPLELPLGLLLCGGLLLVLHSAQHHPRLSLVLLHWLLLPWLQLAGHSKLCREALLHVVLVLLLGLLLVLHWQPRSQGQLSACFCCGVCCPFSLLHDDHHVLLLVLLLVRGRC